MDTITTTMVMARKQRPISRRHPEVLLRPSWAGGASKGDGPDRGRHPSRPAHLGASRNDRVLDARAPQDDGERIATDAAAALYRLMAWLSPAYPIGAFSYSS